MKIPKVEILNFLAIEEAEFGLDDMGLVYISGVNHDETSADNNGSGKSSIGDAISWCLWGSTARDVGGDDVINTPAGKGTRVRITLDDDGDLWRVSRHRKYPKHKNAVLLEHFDGSEWVDRTKGTNKLTQAAIERLMGCSEEVFNSAVYSGQEQMPDLPMMTDVTLKKLVEQAAGVDVLTTAYEIARERLKSAAQSTAQAQIDVDRAVQRKDDAKASLDRLKQQSETWGREHADKLDRLKKQTISAVAEFKSAQKDLDPDAKKELQDDIDACDAKIASVTAERDREKVLQADLDRSRETLRKAKNQEAICANVTQSAREAFEQKRDDLENTRTGKVANCPSCKRPYDESHKEAAIKRAEKDLLAARERVEGAVTDQAAARKKLRAAEKMSADAEKALADHRDSMTDVSAESDKLRNLQREMQLIEATEDEVKRAGERARDLGERFKSEKASKNPFLDMIEESERGLEDLDDDENIARSTLADAKQAEKYAQAVSDVYAPNGVRAFRLDEATPFLNSRTAHYLGSLADGAIDAFWTTVSQAKSGKLVDKFSITVEKAGSAPSFKSLSGGEKRKVRLACALALQDLVAARADKSIDLWIGDEIDDALDQAGLERLMGVLEEKARERGTVLCISHNDIASYARRTMLVEKKNDKAKVIVT